MTIYLTITFCVCFAVWSVLSSTCKSEDKFVKIFRLIPTGILIYIAIQLTGLVLSVWITKYYTAKRSVTPEYTHDTILCVFMVLGVLGAHLFMKMNYKKTDKSNK